MVSKLEKQPTGFAIGKYIMKKIILASAIFNLVIGLMITLFPNLYFNILEVPPPNYTILWQILGMTVAVVGVGFLIAAKDYQKNWPIIFLGFIGKLFGPVIFGIYGVATKSLPLGFLPLSLCDFLWLFPFGYALYLSRAEIKNYFST